MFITEWNITNTDDQRELQARLTEWAPKWLAREKELRDEAFKAPHFFAGDTQELEKLHALIANEFTMAFDRWGWPGLSLLNWDAASALADLARSCWSQPAFMRLCLPLLEQAYRFGDVSGEWFARHYDTLMVFENKPQVYGTFLGWSPTGRLSPWTIVDRARVQARRDAILMRPLREEVLEARQLADARGLRAPQNIDVYLEDMAIWALRVGWTRRSAPAQQSLAARHVL